PALRVARREVTVVGRGQFRTEGVGTPRVVTGEQDLFEFGTAGCVLRTQCIYDDRVLGGRVLLGCAVHARRFAVSTASGRRRYKGTSGSGSAPARRSSAATVTRPAGDGVCTSTAGRSNSATCDGEPATRTDGSAGTSAGLRTSGPSTRRPPE